MPTLELTDEQVLELVKQLPPELGAVTLPSRFLPLASLVFAALGRTVRLTVSYGGGRLKFGLS